jgi:hypothetical protein
MKTTFLFNIEVDQLTELKLVAEEYGTSVAEIIRLLIKKYLEDEPHDN